MTKLRLTEVYGILKSLAVREAIRSGQNAAFVSKERVHRLRASYTSRVS
jgi:hypothetical protein